jgi:hypothetical protein
LKKSNYTQEEREDLEFFANDVFENQDEGEVDSLAMEMLFEDPKWQEKFEAIDNEDDDDSFEDKAMFNPIRRKFSKDNKEVDKKVYNKED